MSHTLASTALAAGTLAVAGLLTGCGSSAATTSAGGAPTTGTVPASTPTGGASNAGTGVTATETDFHIALSAAALHTGTQTIAVINSGQTTHALTVDGPGVQDASTGDISPGATKTLTVTLKPGTYEVYCPVANHKMIGMDTHVTVA